MKLQIKNQLNSLLLVVITVAGMMGFFFACQNENQTEPEDFELMNLSELQNPQNPTSKDREKIVNVMKKISIQIMDGRVEISPTDYTKVGISKNFYLYLENYLNRSIEKYPITNPQKRTKIKKVGENGTMNYNYKNTVRAIVSLNNILGIECDSNKIDQELLFKSRLEPLDGFLSSDKSFEILNEKFSIDSTRTGLPKEEFFQNETNKLCLVQTSSGNFGIVKTSVEVIDWFYMERLDGSGETEFVSKYSIQFAIYINK